MASKIDATDVRRCAFGFLIILYLVALFVLWSPRSFRWKSIMKEAEQASTVGLCFICHAKPATIPVHYEMGTVLFKCVSCDPPSAIPRTLINTRQPSSEREQQIGAAQGMTFFST